MILLFASILLSMIAKSSIISCIYDDEKRKEKQ
jgi:hypothetical protein